MAKNPKKKGILKEFQEFVMRGNVIDLAVGVIIGGAFQSIVTSVINDLIMPVIGLITGGINFNEQFVVLKNPTGEEFASLEAAKAAGATTFNYGSFITAVLNFLIMALVIFLLVKGINKLRSLGHRKTEVVEVVVAPTTKKCPYCCTEIAIEATRCPHCTSVLTEEAADKGAQD